MVIINPLWAQDHRPKLVSSHFEISAVGMPLSNQHRILEYCESARRELAITWGVSECKDEWLPRCLICVHSDRTAYMSVVGHAGLQTEGCSSIEVDKGRIIGRRIDLLANPDGQLGALRHELTHVLIADRFRGEPPPHWFDEGVAMLADHRNKQLLHLRDCLDSVAAGKNLPITTLVSLEQFTSADQLAPFYGQSLTLVLLLTEKRAAPVLIAFALDAKRGGYRDALRKHYQIEDLASLEQEWLVYVRRQTRSTLPVPF